MYRQMLYLLLIVRLLNIVSSMDKGAAPWIVYTNENTIERLEFETWSNISLVRKIQAAVSVDYHFTQGFLYWSDQYFDRITRMNLSNPGETEDIATNGMDLADGIAVDWIYNHLYWIDARYKHIKVSLLNGTLQKTLINTSLTYPRAIVVYPNIGWMFFTDIIEAKIERCALDGSNRRTIISNKTTFINHPNGLSIDFSSNRLYWIDNFYKQMKSSDFNGTDIRVIASCFPSSYTFTPLCWGLVLHGDWLYWTEFLNGTINRIDKETGTHFEVLKSSLNSPVGIKVYGEEHQPKGINLCALNNGSCEQLCLPSPTTVKCACADGFQLKKDGMNCLNIGSGNWLTYSNQHGIERLDLETNVTETVIGGLVNAIDLDIHYEKGFVYWSDVVAKKISRSKVTKDSVSRIAEDIITELIDSPDGIAIDWMYDLLYWTDTVHNHIQVARLDGTSRKTILKDNGLDEPRAIAIDPATGWLFFSDWGNNPRIERCGMDGKGREVIIDKDILWPNGMTIDYIGRRLYWVDGKLLQIKSCQFDGSDTYTVFKNSDFIPHPFDLVVFNNYVYWSNWEFKSISRVHKYSREGYAIVAFYLRKPMGIQMFGEGIQIKGQNLCRQNNGGCSHICFPLPAYNTTKSTVSSCMCPDFYIMHADKKTCIPIESPANIIVSVAGSRVTLSWTLPETIDVIRDTEIQLYNDKNLVYSTSVYYPVTTHSISTVQLQQCYLYKVKLRYLYSQLGWSQYSEEVFWLTDNLIYANNGSNVNISWTTTEHRSTFDILFSSLANNETNLIYADGMLQRNISKYNGLLHDGLFMQFTLDNVLKSDVGLYKSQYRSNSTLIDGCAFLVLTGKPFKPSISYDKYPFVGGKISFTCSSKIQRLPSFVPYRFQYFWFIDGVQQNMSPVIYPIDESDKGKAVSCTAVDERGQISDLSDTFILDPYYGPDDVSLSVIGKFLNSTVDATIGPVTCTSNCYPKCYYSWRRHRDGENVFITNGQNLVIEKATFNDSGRYTCFITHQNETSRIGTISFELHIQSKTDKPEELSGETTTGNIYVYTSTIVAVVIIGICIIACWRKQQTCNRNCYGPQNVNASSIQPTQSRHTYVSIISDGIPIAPPSSYEESVISDGFPMSPPLSYEEPVKPESQTNPKTLHDTADNAMRSLMEYDENNFVVSDEHQSNSYM